MPLLLIAAKYWQILLGAAGILALGIALTLSQHDATDWKRAALAGQRTLDKVKDAQPIAEAAQRAANHAPAAQSQQIAETSNANAPAYYDDVRTAAHAAVVRTDAACPARNADLPGANPPIEGVHGPADIASVVSRPKADDDLLVAAAGRASQMRADAEALIAAGVAVPSDKP